jgi:hypothetical protein
VSWDDVERVDWNPNRIWFLITFERSVGGFRTARFHTFHIRWKGQAPLAGNEVPEIVLWVAGQIKLRDAFPASK